MADAKKVAAWITRKGPTLAATLSAGVDLLTVLKGTATAQGTTVRGLVTGDPNADRALADAAGVAAIAGRHGVTIDDALEATRMILSLVAFVV
jgi:hypothetical protein